MSADIAAINAAVHRYCRTRMWIDDGSRSADDVAQDALIQFFQTTNPDVVDPMGFAICIASRRIIDEIRRRTRGRFQPMGLLNEDEELGNTRRTDVDAIDRLLIEQEERDARASLARVAEVVVLDVLDDKHRQILWLRSGLNLPAVTVGEMLGMSKGAIRVAHHRALARVRTELAHRYAKSSAMTYREPGERKEEPR